MVKKLKLLTWNIRHGGAKKKIKHIIQSFILHNADINVITEFRENESGNKLHRSLHENGWVFQQGSNPPKGKNGILIASKIPFEVPVIHHDYLPQAKHRWNEVHLNDFNLFILGVHIPSIGDKWGKENHWESIIQYAKHKLDSKSVIIGDFNTGLTEDGEGTPFKLVQYMHELNDMGWIDSWRVYHNRVNDFTWYSHADNGFRLDYAYVSPALKENILVSYHSHKERIDKYSDHSLVICELSVENENH
ncbi:endonuclease/exonuclease/phosphatase family protein [Oceanobacillus halotolerans]|uniref:endonuclease/exonuclease/phosphatase family protein n=1 Tax=Oceanobacillus halotolerans TaxID=2663380 RepID=UPI0013D924DC|nr:endonuclease/exonuclease/phosphatase family protein [Oceanobacillus halotolerans]